MTWLCCWLAFPLRPLVTVTLFIHNTKYMYMYVNSWRRAARSRSSWRRRSTRWRRNSPRRTRRRGRCSATTRSSQSRSRPRTANSHRSGRAGKGIYYLSTHYSHYCRLFLPRIALYCILYSWTLTHHVERHRLTTSWVSGIQILSVKEHILLVSLSSVLDCQRRSARLRSRAAKRVRPTSPQAPLETRLESRTTRTPEALLPSYDLLVILLFRLFAAEFCNSFYFSYRFAFYSFGSIDSGTSYEIRTSHSLRLPFPGHSAWIPCYSPSCPIPTSSLVWFANILKYFLLFLCLSGRCFTNQWNWTSKTYLTFLYLLHSRAFNRFAFHETPLPELGTTMTSFLFQQEF